ncbi:MAG: ATP-binding protein [Candidatus Aminicenantes bacterium]|nr:MAG: ATP-binding protein [Candidatus Aminicenantes bacterium]
MGTLSSYNREGEEIETISRITCRIETKEEKGTGIFVHPENSEFVYFITAKHCLLGKDFSKSPEKENTKISIPVPPGKRFETFCLREADNILFPEDTHNDCAIIIIRKDSLPSSCKDIPKVDCLELRYTSGKCFFRGYPRAYENIEGVTIHVNYSDNDTVTTNTPLSCIDSDPLYNCKGFSGSGLFCQLNKKSYLIGIIYELQEPFQRFKVYNLSILNKMLFDHDYPTIKFCILPGEEMIQKDIQKLAERTDLILEGIYDKIGDGFFLERKNVIDNFQEKFAGCKLLIIYGSAGVGKSVMAKVVVKKLEDENYFPLAFKADFFANDSIDSAFKDIKKSIRDIFKELGQKKQIVILIDSLEKLLEIENQEALNEFLRICKKFENIKILITCRTFAYPQLVVHFYHDFPRYASCEIPVLSDKELSEVVRQYPFLENLSNNQSARKILKLPFYLNLIVLHSQLLRKGEDITEREFRKIIWDEVICKNNTERDRTFEKIAIERATSMKLYVRAEGICKDILKQLCHDNIILQEEKLGESYSPAHDIYEDVALIRFIERIYQEKQNTMDFFEKCGKEPAKRRALRLWLNDSLCSIDYNLNAFILEILKSDDIGQYWKDEVITAILRSEYCQKFFDANEEILQKDSFSLFLRFIHLLKTACQDPDEEAMKLTSSTEPGSLYLKPVGFGWETVIRFTRKNDDKLGDFKSIILQLLVNDWAKKLRPEREIPPESEMAGKILISLLEEAQKYYDSWDNHPFSSKDIDKGIQLLFKLASIFPEYVENLINEAQNLDEKKSDSHRISGFHRMVLKYTLSCFESRELCRVLPDLVSEVAQKKWLNPNRTIRNDGEMIMEIESDFGLVDQYEYKAFPPGIYKTPIYFLLRYHPLIALKLITTVLNHSTEAYAQSERGKKNGIVEVEIKTNDGEIITQKGNMTLWAMYRGTIGVAPDLLKSILMSLESWFLELCEISSNRASRLIEIAFDFLLKEGTTVATTAVLASIAIAYPGKIGKKAFPIIKVKEFFEWDSNRWSSDSVDFVLCNYDMELPFAQEERMKSNKLPHRKLSLEQLVTKLQFEGFWEEISEILDEFNKKSKSEDIDWKIQLNRMDFRTFTIDKSTEFTDKKYIPLTPTFSDDLKNVIEERKEEFNKRMEPGGVLAWASNAYDKDPNTEKTAKKWKEVYKYFKKLDEDRIKEARTFGDPTYLAALGIRDYYLELDPEQQKWCIDTVLNVLEARIVKNIKKDFLSFSTIYFQPAIDTAALILSFDNIDQRLRLRTKVIIFLSLLHLNIDVTEYPYESMRKNLWKIDPAFATSCFAGLIEYSKLYKKKVYHHLPTIEEQKKFLQDFAKKEEALVYSVIENPIKLDFNDISLENSSVRFLVFASLILPFETHNTSHQRYIRLIFELLFALMNKKDDGWYSNKGNDFSLSNIFKEYLSKFLLFQPKEFSTKFFGETLDKIYLSEIPGIQEDAFDFVKEIIKQLIVDAEALGTKNFWHLWEVLENKIKNSNKPIFLSYLFLAPLRWSPYIEHWPPLENKKDYFKRLIIDLGCLDIQAVTRLLSGIGTKTLLPDGIVWLKSALGKIQNPLEILNHEDAFLIREQVIAL